MHKRLIAMAALATLVFAACGPGGTATTGPGSSTPAATTPAGSASAGCLVGVSWNNYTQERWAKADEPNIKAAVEAGGGTYTRTDAKDNSEQQLADVDNLIAQGAKVLIILAKDAEAIKPAIAKAKAAGIPVIGYDRLIEDPDVFYITFDNKRVGTIIAQEVMKVAPSGDYVIIKGDPGDANAQFLRDGMTEAGIPAELNTPNAAGIQVVFEQNTANWDTAGARTNMEAALAATENKVDAVLSAERRHGDRRHRGARRRGPHLGPGRRPGRRQGRPQPCRPRDPDGVGLEERQRPRQGCRRRGDPALCMARRRCRDRAGRALGQRQADRVEGREVHDAGWQLGQLDHPQPDADHQGQPVRGRRRRLGHQGRGLRRRHRRFGQPLLIP